MLLRKKTNLINADEIEKVGEAILGVFAIFIRDYFTLQWVMSVAILVQVKENADC